MSAQTPANPYTQNLDKCAANYQPLTPLTFLQRAAEVYPRTPRSSTARCG